MHNIICLVTGRHVLHMHFRLHACSHASYTCNNVKSFMRVNSSCPIFQLCITTERHIISSLELRSRRYNHVRGALYI